jgi:UPF0042 nucleotide-binding protein
MAKLIVIRGSSGAGKSSALRLLEDEGYYCIDNLPPRLLPHFTEEVMDHPSYRSFRGIAVCIDARAVKAEQEETSQALSSLLESKDRLIIFLDAQPHILLKRFSETRRRHPLAGAGHSLPEAIVTERQFLEPIAAHADLLIDTSDLTPKALRHTLITRVIERPEGLSLLIKSFAFKRGVPSDADFVIDARSLPNPYWVAALKDLSGRDQPVIEFLEKDRHCGQFVDHLTTFLTTALPSTEDLDRSYVTIAVGCTGGQHRSVYVAEYLYRQLVLHYPLAQLRHRELNLEAGT